MRLQAGTTLFEILATLSVAAVLAAMAAPGLRSLRLDAQRIAAVNGYFHALFLARSEAVKRGLVISVCRSPDSVRCANREREWTSGWIVFVNQDHDEPAERDRDEPVLVAAAGWRSGRITSNRVTFSYRPYGRSAVNGTIVFCDPRGPAHSRAIIISPTGRPRISQRDASNKPLPCLPT